MCPKIDVCQFQVTLLQYHNLCLGQFHKCYFRERHTSKEWKDKLKIEDKRNVCPKRDVCNFEVTEEQYNSLCRKCFLSCYYFKHTPKEWKEEEKSNETASFNC